MEVQPEVSEPSIGGEPLPVVPVRAIVQAGSTETRYCRTGIGAPVLVLSAGGTADALTVLLLHRLARGCRVIAPEPPGSVGEETSPLSDGAGVSVSRWLRDVIDGLGLDRPSLVADESFAFAALEFALLDPERVNRLALIRPASSAARVEGYELDCALQDRLARAGHPLLLLGIGPASESGTSAESATAELARFLNGSEDGDPGAGPSV